MKSRGVAIPSTPSRSAYIIDTETKGSTAFRDLKALGCSDRAQQSHY